MNTKQILDYYINIGKNNTKKYKIALVANVRGKTKNYVDFDSSSVINEYFSLTLYEEIQRTLRNAGYEVCTFFDEDDFIKSISKIFELYCFENIKKFVSNSIFDKIYGLFEELQEKGLMDINEDHIELKGDGLFWGNTIGREVISISLEDE